MVTRIQMVQLEMGALMAVLEGLGEAEVEL